MSINVKKCTKDQMAKMVEDAQAEVQELKRVNVALTEQIDQMNGEAINKANEIANLKADLDAANAASKLLNDQGQQYWRAWQASKREVADLKNKLNDVEVTLGRENACIATMQVERDQQTKDCFEWQRSAQALHDDLLNARERAHYAEAHPWRNLWAWVKRKLGGERTEHVS